jgi:hypothetical protein
VIRFGHEIEALALDLASSLWAELGVDGSPRRHDWQAIDLEPLIIFTAFLGGADSRLRANSIDWCIANARLASAFRLRHIAREATHATRESFGRYAATVEAHAKVSWPSHGDPLALWPSDHIGAPDLRRPSLVQLRLRALVGVSARAEILRLLLAEPERTQSASGLADAAGYGKGSVAQALDLLTMAGVVNVQPAANRLVYRLARPADLAQALQWLPSTFPDWWPIFKVTEAIATYARSAPATAPARAASVKKVVENIDADLHRLGIADQVPAPAGTGSVAEFEHWALSFVADRAGRGEAARAGAEITYTVRHLSFGGWIGEVNRQGRRPRSLEPVAENGGRTARSAGETLDEQSGATQLAHAMFRDVTQAATHAPTGAHAALVGVISREFAQELLLAMRAGQEATFTAEFLRRWYHNRRQRFGATA